MRIQVADRFGLRDGSDPTGVHTATNARCPPDAALDGATRECIGPGSNPGRSLSLLVGELLADSKGLIGSRVTLNSN
jgi:hypothetical protein